jgi:outer membrane protein assembly factor BamD
VLQRLQLSVLLSLAFLAGCATKEADWTAGWTPEKLYAEAKDELNNKLYEKAITLYEKLEGRAAGTQLAQQAQLEKAYAQYKNGDPVLAVATLDRFIKINPASPALDYALYLKGIVNFNEDLGMLSFISKQDLSERDQKAAKESFEAFRELVTRFPDSKYSEDARLRMRYSVNILAKSEINVARFYLKKGAYVAAINRAQAALNDYRDVPALEDALNILIECYDKLGLTQLRDDTKRVLAQSFPESQKPAVADPKKSGPWWKLW